jgi:hypothetical protein
MGVSLSAWGGPSAPDLKDTGLLPSGLSFSGHRLGSCLSHGLVALARHSGQTARSRVMSPESRRGPVRSLLCCLAAVGLILAACQSQSPSRSSMAPTPVELSPIDSGGLGLTREEWVQRFGPLRNVVGGSGFADVGTNRNAFIIFTGSRVQNISIDVSSERLTENEAQDIAMSFLPRDAEYLYRSPGTTCMTCPFWITGDRLLSASLAHVHSVCAKRLWKDAHPGEIRIGIRMSTRDRSSPVRSINVYWACDAP